jgi:hypothetical protein
MPLVVSLAKSGGMGYTRWIYEFDEDTKETKYFSLLPPGAKPPLDLNKEMMEKYRPAMRKFEQKGGV